MSNIDARRRWLLVARSEYLSLSDQTGTYAQTDTSAIATAPTSRQHYSQLQPSPSCAPHRYSLHTNILVTCAWLHTSSTTTTLLGICLRHACRD
eukprot:m.191394 g.191394  ORF g.191394 m.191394 type:complete len:94 (+) comp14840_c0_seq2:2916-3197(+)